LWRFPCRPVLFAEVVANYFPRHVELHNYSPANGTDKKLYNWNTLNSATPRTRLPSHSAAPLSAADADHAEHLLRVLPPVTMSRA
jgi:hypothetical protein